MEGAADIGVYPYPNFNIPYFHNVADRFESDGADFSEDRTLFVGGTLYGHEFKAWKPETDVTVVEQNPLTAYLQTFLAHELADGASPGTARERIFDYSHRVRETGVGLHPMDDGPALHRLGTDREELAGHVDRHRAFAASDWWPHDYGIPDRILAETGNGSRQDLEDALYAAVVDGDGRQDARLSLKPADISTEINPGVLQDVAATAQVDSIEIGDIRDVDGDYDVVFTNNVFDYVDHSDVTGIVDSITADTGAYMEAALLGTQFYMDAAGFDSVEDYRTDFDRQIPATMEPLAIGPDVGFFSDGREEMYADIDELPDIVRLYRPA
ncbi:MAG: hypothetical protein SVU88_04465 [Candidatus Nanohaloarchaea archaeon]|nr:hypothetical protein [Candidatus Nanohaloarchaea archaeon]